jgi:cyclic-di-GMP-binding protein
LQALGGPVYIGRPHPEPAGAMAKTATFDITSTVDLQEVDNALNQARKEISQRYDFKGATVEIEFNRKDGALDLLADDEYKLNAVVEVLQGKLAKRGVPIRNLDYGEVEQAFGGKARQRVTLVQGISTEKGKEIVKAIKAAGFKKVNAQIQDEQVRVTSPSIDELQAVIAELRKQDFGIELSFGNFRS